MPGPGSRLNLRTRPSSRAQNAMEIALEIDNPRGQQGCQGKSGCQALSPSSCTRILSLSSVDIWGDCG